MSIIYANYLKRLPGSFFPRGIGFLSYEPIENPLRKIEEAALEESQHYPLPKMREIQLSVTKKLIKYAYKTVPFWKELFDESGIKPADVKSWSDFEKISITNKAILKTAGYGKYLASNQPKGDFIMDTTSGSKTNRAFKPGGNRKKPFPNL
ncbi:MAG: hypothetical protein HYW88_01310 [Candidatus Sungbacteria bacterium]|nr:hypothetical protein [Candidatus Sungbacteria bacterium]